MIFGERMTPRYLLRRGYGFDHVRDFAQTREWASVAYNVADPAREARWLTSTTITLQYEEDLLSRQPYVFYAGDDFDALPELVTILLESLSLWSRDELLQADAETGPERARAVLRSGLGAPMEFDQEFFDVINACIESDVTPLRDAGVLAAGGAAWPQFRPVLRRVAGADPEAEVRDLAQAALRAFDKFRIGEP